jgi:hypothetical protein
MKWVVKKNLLASMQRFSLVDICEGQTILLVSMPNPNVDDIGVF